MPLRLFAVHTTDPRLKMGYGLAPSYTVPCCQPSLSSLPGVCFPHLGTAPPPVPSTGPRWSPPSSLDSTSLPLMLPPDALVLRLPKTGSPTYLFFSQLPDSTNPNSNPSTMCLRTRPVLSTESTCEVPCFPVRSSRHMR